MVVLLAQTPFHILKEIPSSLWSKAIELPNNVEHIVDIIGEIKHFDEKNVCPSQKN